MLGKTALLTLPISTGLASVMWSKLATESPIVVSVLNVAVYSLVTVLFAMTGGPIVLPDARYAAGYVAMNVIVSLSWIWALREDGVASIAFVEMGYPFFILLFSALMLGSSYMTRMQLLGGMIILSGTMLIVTGGSDVQP